MLCKYASHALYPYYYSLKHGSKFRWVKKDLLVHCPKPHGTYFEIVGDKARAVVGCPDFAKGEIIDLKDTKPFDCGEIDGQVINQSHDKTCRYFHEWYDDIKLPLINAKTFCDLYPKTLCMLYDGKPPVDERISVHKKPLMNLLYRALKMVGLHKDVIDKKISFNLPDGMQHEFNLHDNKEICPAMYYTLLPFFKDKPYWADLSSVDICCPDYKAKVIYRYVPK